MGGRLTVHHAATRSAPSARAIAEGALLADLTVLVVLIGLYVPYAGPALAAVSPIPLLLLVLRQGWRVSIESIVAACLLVTFLTGPFSSFAVLTIALRACALGIGLRHGWPVRKTILAGTAFLWAIVWVAVTLIAIAFPAWRAATEQGMILTYHQLTGLSGLLLKGIGFGWLWADLRPAVNDFLPWFIKHWLLLLPAIILPLLLVAVSAEYVIVEVILPRFGVHPPPLRFFWAGSAGGGQPPRGGAGTRVPLQLALEARLAERRAQTRAGSGRHMARSALAVLAVDARSGSSADTVKGEDSVHG
ncbi:MAG: DUF2232 domain-containing protein [Dehalococcoidia bacterium]